jgi:hypothetical protein
LEEKATGRKEVEVYLFSFEEKQKRKMERIGLSQTFLSRDLQRAPRANQPPPFTPLALLDAESFFLVEN